RRRRGVPARAAGQGRAGERPPAPGSRSAGVPPAGLSGDPARAVTAGADRSCGGRAAPLRAGGRRRRPRGVLCGPLHPVRAPGPHPPSRPSLSKPRRSRTMAADRALGARPEAAVPGPPSSRRSKMRQQKSTTKRAARAVSRRAVLAGAAAAAGIGALGFPTIRARAAETLKVGTYGGYFRDSFDKHIYPDFTAETGIEIESIAEPTGEAWLVQLDTAARAGVAPADVSMMAQVARLKGSNSGLWAPLDESRLENVANLQPHFVQRNGDDRIDSIGAVSWYITLVTDTE